jgi:hypothetical protein
LAALFENGSDNSGKGVPFVQLGYAFSAISNRTWRFYFDIFLHVPSTYWGKASELEPEMFIVG